MGDLAGTWVTVRPDMGEFKEDLSAGLDAAVEGEDRSIRIDADISEVEAKIALVDAEADALSAKPHEIKVTADTSSIPDMMRLLNTKQFGSADPIGDFERKLSGVGTEDDLARFAALQSQFHDLGDTSWASDASNAFDELSTKTLMYSADAELALGSSDKLLASIAGLGEAAENAGGSGGGGGLVGWLSDAEGEGHLLWGTLLGLSPALASIAEVGVGGTFTALPGIFSGMATAGIAAAGAIESIKGALSDYSAANTDTGQTASEAHQQLETLNAAMAALSPSARNVVDVIEGQLLPAWHSFEQADSTAFFNAASSGVSDLIPLFQEMTPYILDAATGIGTVFSDLAKWSQSTEGIATINTLLQEGNGLFKDFGQAAEDGIEGFLNMGAQAGPVVSGIGGAAERAAAAFDKWSTDGGAQKFIQMIVTEAPTVLHLLGTLVSTITDVTKDLSELGPVMDPVLTAILGLADDLAKLSPGLVQFAAIFGGVGLALGIGKVTSGLAGLATALGSAGLAGEAETATSETGSLLTNLHGLAGIGTIGITIAVATELLSLTNQVNKNTPSNDSTLGNERGLTASDFNPVNWVKGLVDPKSLEGSALPKWEQMGYTSEAAYQFALSQTKSGALGPLGPSNAPKTPATKPKTNSLFDNSVAGSGSAPLSPAQQLAQTLTSSANSMLSTLTGLAAPAKNAVVAQRTSIAQSTPAFNTLVAQLVAAHQSALSALIPQLVAAHKADLSQLNQLIRTQAVTMATAVATNAANNQVNTINGNAQLGSDQSVFNGPGGGTAAQSAQVAVDQIANTGAAAIEKAQTLVTAATNGTQLQQALAAKALADATNTANVNNAAAKAGLTAATALQQVADVLSQQAVQSTTDTASGQATAIGDAMKVALDEANSARGGSTAVTSAQQNVDLTQQATDAAVTAAQDQVDAAMSGTKAEQDAAAQQLAIAQANQTVQMAAANAQLSAAQAEQQAAVQLEQTSATIATDVGNAMSSMISDLSTIATDAAASGTDAVTAATSLAADISASAVQSINDQSAIATDTLAEAGKSGVALQAAQAKVALDELTASYNQQIGAAKVSNDTANAQQTALVDAAKTNLDTVTTRTQTAVNNAQAAYDATLNSNDAVAQATAATVLANAKADQQTQVAAAQSTYAAAQASAAAIAAQGAQALQGVQDQAQIAEAQQQAIINKLDAQAAGSGGTVVTVEINGVPDALSGVDQMMLELKLAGVA